jgi:PPP family 3-phenylpropionic acid transporter
MHERSKVLDTASERRGSKELTHSRVLYFGYYLAMGAFMPYIYLYYERMGLSGVQIGTLAATTVLVGSSAALILSGIGDAFAWQNRILKIALFLSPIWMFILSKATTLQELIVVIIFYALFSSPIIPILDSSALIAAKTNQANYGSLRLWGTIGWSISTLLVGMLIDKFDIRWLFYGYIVFMTFTFVMSLTHSAQMPRLKASIGHGLNHLLRPYFFMFLLSILLLSITSGGFLSFFSIYLDGINASEGLIGFAWTLASLSEIPIMLGAGWMIRKISTSGLLKISFLAYALRWLLLSFISTPVLAILTQLLHGLSFAAFLIGGITYIGHLAPEGLNTTAQSIFTSVSFGLASIIGSLLGGYFYDTWGMSAMFRSFSLIAFFGLLIFYLSDRLREKAKMISVQS